MLCNRRTVRDCRRSVHSLRRRFGTFLKTSRCYRRKIRRRCRKIFSIQLNIKRMRREMGGFLYLFGQFAQHMHNSFRILRKRCAGDAVRRAMDALKHRRAPSRTRRCAKKPEAELVVLPTSERFVPTADRSQQICLGYERLGGNLCAQQVVCRRGWGTPWRTCVDPSGKIMRVRAKTHCAAASLRKAASICVRKSGDISSSESKKAT